MCALPDFLLSTTLIKESIKSGKKILDNLIPDCSACYLIIIRSWVIILLFWLMDVGLLDVVVLADVQ